MVTPLAAMVARSHVHSRADVPICVQMVACLILDCLSITHVQADPATS
jgi:hypothetical protein